jgi:hypothetical protein
MKEFIQRYEAQIHRFRSRSTSTVMSGWCGNWIRGASRYGKFENAFMCIDDFAKAPKLSDRFTSLDWPRLLTRYAKKVNPLLGNRLHSMSYYGVTTQSAYPRAKTSKCEGQPSSPSLAATALRLARRAST